VALAAIVSMLAAVAPATAADRESFAYLSESSEFGWELVVTGSGGAQRVQVTADAVGRPAIAPSGSKIAYAAPIGDGTLGRFAIYISNLDGSGRSRLTSPALGDRDPAWSPDGQWIAYSRNVNDDLNGTRCCAIRLIRQNGTGFTGLPNSAGGRNPAWSPDGTQIAYETPAGVYISDLDGSNRYQLAGASGAEPAWSPDGSKIAYTRPRGEGSELVVRPADGGNTDVRVSTTTFKIESPVWDKNGSTIYYVRHRGVGYLGRTDSNVYSHTPGVGQRLAFDPGGDIAHLSRVQRASGGCDFDGDGFDDLAIGVTGDNTGKNNSGSVNVLYGSGPALASDGAQIWHRLKNSIIGSPAVGAELGASVTCGDFNGDDYSDLAAGAPGDDSGQGSVMVVYGSASGLKAAKDQRWHQDSAGLPSTAQEGDRFGGAVVAADFDGDGFDDLAIGAPGDAKARGAVHVLFGTGNGLSTSGDMFLRQGAGGVDGTRQPNEELGFSLAAGDFDGDGFAELAIGTPGERLTGRSDMGSVLVLAGSASGLDTGADMIWHQDVAGVEGSAEAGDRFGESLTTGDFNGDGLDDLGIGVPDEDFGDVVGAGSVQVLLGSNDGLSADNDARFFKGFQGVGGTARTGDRFGAALGAGDFDGDGFDDLGVGSPGSRNDAGAVSILYGSGSGVDGSRDQLWDKATSGVLGARSGGDRFGAALTAGDYDGDGFLDLAVGTPGEVRSEKAGAGAVHVLYGSANAITAVGDQVWHQDSEGVPGAARTGDALGSGLR
jgi:hypothetical protein